MIWLRLFLGLVAAGLFLLVFGPVRLLAKYRGWRFGRNLPVVFHRLLCATLRLRIRRFGRPSSASRRLIVANHVSWLDIPALGACEPMAFLAKKEVGDRLLGRIVVALQGGLYVDRLRKRAIPQVNAEMALRIRAGDPVLLFAEATSGDGNRVLKFRSSHFEAIRQAGAGVDGPAVIQPVFLRYCRIAGLPVARIDRPVFAWYGDMTFWPHLRGLLRAGAIVCEVHYGDPLPVEADSAGKPLAEATERAVRDLAGQARAADLDGSTSAIPAGRETG